MSDSIRHRMWRFETTPPPGMWPRIAERLEEEFDAGDAALSVRVDQADLAPPADSWKEISSFLDGESRSRYRAPLVPLFYRRLAAAVAVAAVLGLTAMYLFTSNSQDNFAAGVTTIKPPSHIQLQSSKLLTVPSPALILGSRLQASLHDFRTPRPSGLVSNGQVETVSDEADDDLTPAPISARVVAASQPVAVPSQPIRDRQGNIVMDLNLVTGPNDTYITVTGPNGQQTRMSCKFLPCLTYLNNDAADDGSEWSSRFKEWRAKLLNTDNYVPAAANFSDIFEMKDLIQE